MFFLFRSHSRARSRGRWQEVLQWRHKTAHNDYDDDDEYMKGGATSTISGFEFPAPQLMRAGSVYMTAIRLQRAMYSLTNVLEE